MKVKVSNYVSRYLVQAGITDVFTVTGGGAMHLNDALGHQEGLTCWYNHHEQASAIAAEAYARIHNRIALVCVTTGPGGTNALTGVVGGYLDSIPMLILSGQVRYDTTARSTGLHIRAMGDQEFDITKAVASMTKYCEMVIDPMRIRFCLEKALYLAQHGRPGPCWLDIPLNVQGAYVEEDELAGFDPLDYEAGGTGWGKAGEASGAAVSAGKAPFRNPHQIPEDTAGAGERREKQAPPVTRETAAEIIRRVRAAKRPVINAGNGIRIAGAHDVFMRVVDKLAVPVVTGWNSQDCMFDEHPLYVGRAGGMGDRPGNFAVQNSDLVLSLGSRLSIRQVGYNYETWARAAYVIVNDIDAEELKKPSIHVDMPVHADVKNLLEALEAELDAEDGAGKPDAENDARTLDTETGAEAQGVSGAALKSRESAADKGGGDEAARERQKWISICQSWKRDYPVVLPKHYEGGKERPANVYALVKELSRRLSEGQITVVGNGSACVVGGHAYVIKPGQRFITNSAIASMGYDLPAAIGACVADHSQDIILLTGDGSIQMNLQELQTIIHHRMPIKIFLINNGGYHSIRQTQKNFFGDPLVGIGVDSGDLSFPQMEKLAAAYGYPYVSAENNEELQEAIETTLAMEGPVICEVFVTMDQVFEPKSAAKRLPDGTMVSPPLEDLSPFLPDEEMDKIMIIDRIRE